MYRSTPGITERDTVNPAYPPCQPNPAHCGTDSCAQADERPLTAFPGG